jgi:serine/threonine protein kinase
VQPPSSMSIIGKSHQCPQWLQIPCAYQNFTLLSKLHRMKRSVVYVAQWTENKELFVLKRYDKNAIKPHEIEMVKQEVLFGKRLEHPHILCIYGGFETANSIYVLSEYCKNRDLFYYIYNGKNDYFQGAALITKFLKPLINAVQYLHRLDIVHCDIKPENILFHQNRLVLADFGLARDLNDASYDNLPIGYTPEYRAPELSNLTQDPVKSVDLKKIDIWCIGLTIFELLFKVLPKNISNIEPLPSELESHMSNILQNVTPEQRLAVTICHDCLKYNPDMRPSIDEIMSTLDELL